MDVIDHGPVVHIGHMRRANIDNRSVIEKVAAAPIAALVSPTAVAIAIVDAAIETNLRAPVSRVPDERGALGGPVAWRP
jgi:hypothetical protein